MEMTDNQLKAIYVIAGTIVFILLAIKTNALEFILGNFKIKSKNNNLKENPEQNINPAIQASTNKNSNINIGGNQNIYNALPDTLEKPDILVKSSIALIAQGASIKRNVMSIEIQNRSTQIVYFGNIFFKQSNDKITIPLEDCLTKEPQKRKVLNPGEKFSFNVDPKKLVNAAKPSEIINVAIRDDIDRIYEGDETDLKGNLEVLLTLSEMKNNR